MSTVFLWISSDQGDLSSVSVTDFRVNLTNRIENPVSCDLVQFRVNYFQAMNEPLFISSRALGNTTISGAPNGSGLQRWWRAVPYMPDALATNQTVNAFYNPRMEYTPVKQEFLKDIDIQITDINAQPYPGIVSVAILVAVKVRE